jgi:Arc/MetJ-type ribon-helix-helix transcriptional regulator
MKMITLYLDPKDIEYADSLVKEGRYPNRSEMLRHFIRNGLREERLLLKTDEGDEE